MSSIFNITERLMKAYELALIEDIDQETIDTTIECIEFELKEKADNYANLISDVNGDISVIENEISRLQTLKKRKQNFIDRLKFNLYNSMKLSDETKLKTPLHSCWIQLNPPALKILDESEIPQKFFVVPPPQLNRESLKRVLMDGGVIPGAALTQSEGIRIR